MVDLRDVSIETEPAPLLLSCEGQNGWNIPILCSSKRDDLAPAEGLIGSIALGVALWTGLFVFLWVFC